MTLDASELALLEECHFIVSWQQLQETTGWDSNKLRNTLKKLLSKGYIDQWYMDNQIGDYVRSEKANMDNVEAFCYLANKKGLLACYLGGDI